jgi:hypothetical protein
MNRLQRFLPPDIHKKDGKAREKAKAGKKTAAFLDSNFLRRCSP